ncbi:MAG: HPr kinase/phosphorylase [Candidatus Anoxychlamydiales bacterium]|nr:HPr kinase/phosphorylase [Candidatus Anoxychlamydiales bacterium]
MIYRVEDFYKKHKNSLKLELFAGEKGLKKRIKKPEVHRPGLSLTGYIKNYKSYRILVIGKGEIQYLKELDPKKRLIRLREILTKDTPAVIISKKITPLKELKIVCDQHSIALFGSDIETMALISKMIIDLSYEFSQTKTMHGTLVEVFGMGVLIQGESSVGKSEAALGLLEKGHRLISDDVVKIRKKDENSLIGSGPEITRHLMEVRGLGIINVAHLYGAVCVRENIVLDIVIKLEPFDPSHFYDRVGLEDKCVDILGVKIPFHLVFVNPGRDVVLLIETLTLNQRLKNSGYNSAKEFNIKLLQKLAKRNVNTSEIS